MEESQNDIKTANEKSGELNLEFLNESQKYLPHTKMLLSQSKPPKPKKLVNLTAYAPHHMQIEKPLREQLDMLNRQPLAQPIWERSLPSTTNRSARKPLAIEESLVLGYRNRMD